MVMSVDNVTVHYQPKGNSQMIYTVGNNILANLQNSTVVRTQEGEHRKNSVCSTKVYLCMFGS